MNTCIRFFLLFVAFLGLSFTHLSAQEIGTFSEDFSNVSESWFIEENEQGISRFSDGKYYLESKTSEGYYSYIPKVMVGDKNPFEATFSVTWLSGTSQEWGYGLTWGKGLTDKVTTLVFSGSLSYMLYQFDKKYKILEDPVFCPYMVPGKPNLINVKYDGKKLTVLVNDKLLFSGKAKQWGGTFAFVLFEKQSVVIDDLKIVRAYPF